MTITAPKKKRNMFINNADFYAALVKYKSDRDDAVASGKIMPRLPNYIGKCFVDIAEHLSMRPNFSNYIFREDMVMDAVENMVVCASNFDPEKSKNPFSYFTQVAWYAFIRKISKEKKQISICDKIIENSNYDTFFEGAEGGSGSDYNSIKDSVNQKTRLNRRESND
jgi:hypothetical protein